MRIFTVLLVSFVIACNKVQTPIERAESLVTETLVTNLMTHPDSYQPQEFSPLDSLYSQIEEENQYLCLDSLIAVEWQNQEFLQAELARIQRSRDNLQRLAIYGTINTNYLDSQYAEIHKSLKYCNVKMDSLARVRDSLIANYVPEFIGFQISHKFKYLSATGFPVEGDMTFFLDSMIQHIPHYKGNKWNVLFIYDNLTQKYKPNYDNIRLSD